MKNEYSTSDKPEILAGLRNVGIFLVICLVIALIGSSNHPLWLLLVCPVLVGGFAYFVGNKNKNYGIFGFALGLLAAILWNVFGI